MQRHMSRELTNLVQLDLFQLSNQPKKEKTRNIVESTLAITNFIAWAIGGAIGMKYFGEHSPRLFEATSPLYVFTWLSAFFGTRYALGKGLQFIYNRSDSHNLRQDIRSF